MTAGPQSFDILVVRITLDDHDAVSPLAKALRHPEANVSASRNYNMSIAANPHAPANDVQPAADDPIRK